MSFYTVTGSKTVTATTSPLNVTGGTTARPRICTYKLATGGVPTSDQGVEVQMRRSTTAGTGTSVTPTPTDTNDPASITAALSNLTAEPTYSAGSIDDLFFNPRATVQWAAYDPRAEFVAPATASNGIGFQCIAVGGAAGALLVTIGFYDR
jgi:hypothetical protein